MQQHSGTIKLNREQRRRDRAAAKAARLRERRTRNEVKDDGSNIGPKPDQNPGADRR
jgi:hypothetical protein